MLKPGLGTYRCSISEFWLNESTKVNEQVRAKRKAPRLQFEEPEDLRTDQAGIHFSFLPNSFLSYTCVISPLMSGLGERGCLFLVLFFPSPNTTGGKKRFLFYIDFNQQISECLLCVKIPQWTYQTVSWGKGQHFCLCIPNLALLSI